MLPSKPYLILRRWARSLTLGVRRRSPPFLSYGDHPLSVHTQLPGRILWLDSPIKFKFPLSSEMYKPILPKNSLRGT